jgi:hypothetical protein
MNPQTMTDEELKEARKVLPRYLNEGTEEQAALHLAIYHEQKRRYDVKQATETTEYNRQVEAAGYKVGDKVSYFAVSMLGIGGMTVCGTVAKRKKYYVKLDGSFNGQKTAHLTKAWRVAP